VLAVLTGADAAADGIGPIPHSPVPTNPHEVPLKSRDGSDFFLAPHPVLAHDATRYVGEPVALIVAGTPAQAVDAAELIEVTYRPLPAVTRSRDALEPGAPVLWPQHGSNLCVDSEAGDREAVEAAFARAAHVVRLETTLNRVTGVPMELRAAVGAHDAPSGRFTVYTSAGGGVIRQRNDIASSLGVPNEAVRVVSGDVGGNFGIRNNTCPEFVLVAWAAKRIGRPVKWVCDRRDAFLGDFHGRDLTCEAELALDRDGNILALRGTNISNLGAGAISFVPLAKGIAVSSGVYRIPVSYLRGLAVVTNTAPSSAYRSAGRPEVVFVLERLIDIACRCHGFDRLDLRLRNLVPPEAMPYRNPQGLVYDSGDYPASLRRAAELGDWAGCEIRRAEARTLSRHRDRGLGRAEYRRAARTRRDDNWSIGRGRAGPWDDVGGAGTRNQLRADCRRMARRRSRAARGAVAPPASPQEGVLVFVPVGGGALDGLFNLGPGLEAAALQRQGAQDLPPRLDQVQLERDRVWLKRG
jgi:aerobic carbon-monoxide dehydrogenase large subunit